MNAERQYEVAVITVRHCHREMIVDAFLQLMKNGQAVGGGEIDLRLRKRVDCARRRQLMDGHSGAP
jgi:hypothetical protein